MSEQPVDTITIRIVKPLKQKIITYHATVIIREPTLICARAQWTHPTVTLLGMYTLDPGDYLFEYFYTNRWYNIYEMYTALGSHKGWYCNLTRPAEFTPEMIISEDLELDIIVSPDRHTVHVLDEDEYEQRQLASHEPAAHAAVMAALDELHTLIRQGSAPFDAAHFTVPDAITERERHDDNDNNDNNNDHDDTRATTRTR